MTSWPLFQDIAILRRDGVAILLTPSKLQPGLLNQPLKTQKTMRNYILKCNLYWCFLIY